MKGRAEGLVGLVLIVVALSGCSGGDAAAPQDAQGTSVIQASSEAGGSGVLAGLVVTDALEPIPGAVAALEGVTGQATTDEGGRFQFTNLAAGKYKLFTGKLGFESDARNVEIVDGATTEVTVTLANVAMDVERIEKIETKLHMACGGGFVAVTFTGGPCGQLSSAPHRVTYDHKVTTELVSAIGELIWTRNTGLSSQEFLFTMGKDERVVNGFTEFTHPYADETGPSPVQIRVDEEFDGTDGLEPGDDFNIRFRIWVPFSSDQPPIIVVVVDQAMTMWSSMAYGVVPPEDYTALPDN